MTKEDLLKIFEHGKSVESDYNLMEKLTNDVEEGLWEKWNSMYSTEEDSDSEIKLEEVLDKVKRLKKERGLGQNFDDPEGGSPITPVNPKTPQGGGGSGEALANSENSGVNSENSNLTTGRNDGKPPKIPPTALTLPEEPEEFKNTYKGDLGDIENWKDGDVLAEFPLVADGIDTTNKDTRNKILKALENVLTEEELIVLQESIDFGSDLRQLIKDDKAVRDTVNDLNLTQKRDCDCKISIISRDSPESVESVQIGLSIRDKVTGEELVVLDKDEPNSIDIQLGLNKDCIDIYTLFPMTNDLGIKGFGDIFIVALIRSILKYKTYKFLNICDPESDYWDRFGVANSDDASEFYKETDFDHTDSRMKEFGKNSHILSKKAMELWLYLRGYGIKPSDDTLSQPNPNFREGSEDDRSSITPKDPKNPQDGGGEALTNSSKNSNSENSSGGGNGGKPPRDNPPTGLTPNEPEETPEEKKQREMREAAERDFGLKLPKNIEIVAYSEKNLSYKLNGVLMPKINGEAFEYQLKNIIQLAEKTEKNWAESIKALKNANLPKKLEARLILKNGKYELKYTKGSRELTFKGTKEEVDQKLKDLKENKKADSLVVGKDGNVISGGADLARIIETEKSKIIVIADGVGSGDDVGSKNALNNILDAIPDSFKNAVDNAKTIKELAGAGEKLVKAIEKEYRKLEESLQIAVAFVFKNDVVKETVIISAGDCLIFDEKGNLLVAPHNVFSKFKEDIISKITRLDEMAMTKAFGSDASEFEELIKQKSAYLKSLQDTFVAPPWLIVPENMSSEEFLDFILDQINIAITQISPKGDTSLNKIIDELTNRGFDPRNLVFQDLFVVLQDYVFVSDKISATLENLHSVAHHIYSYLDSRGNTNIKTTVVKTPKVIVGATDGMEGGGILPNGTSETDFRKIIPELAGSNTDLEDFVPVKNSRNLSQTDDTGIIRASLGKTEIAELSEEVSSAVEIRAILEELNDSVLRNLQNYPDVPKLSENSSLLEIKIALEIAFSRFVETIKSDGYEQYQKNLKPIVDQLCNKLGLDLEETNKKLFASALLKSGGYKYNNRQYRVLDIKERISVLLGGKGFVETYFQAWQMEAEDIFLKLLQEELKSLNTKDLDFICRELSVPSELIFDSKNLIARINNNNNWLGLPESILTDGFYRQNKLTLKPDIIKSLDKAISNFENCNGEEVASGIIDQLRYLRLFYPNEKINIMMSNLERYFGYNKNINALISTLWHSMNVHQLNLAEAQDWMDLQLQLPKIIALAQKKYPNDVSNQEIFAETLTKKVYLEVLMTSGVSDFVDSKKSIVARLKNLPEYMFLAYLEGIESEFGKELTQKTIDILGTNFMEWLPEDIQKQFLELESIEVIVNYFKSIGKWQPVDIKKLIGSSNMSKYPRAAELTQILKNKAIEFNAKHLPPKIKA